MPYGVRCPNKHPFYARHTSANGFRSSVAGYDEEMMLLNKILLLHTVNRLGKHRFHSA